MENHAVQYQQTYRDFKSELDHELKTAANSFINIGVLLMKARDTDILKDSGYTSVTDFAMGEYKIDSSQVSRFIGIAERFTVNGELKDEFRSYGVAKLGIMLTLPDHMIEELSPEMSKAEIKAVADEVKEEQKITPIERALEDNDISDLGFIEQILYKLGEDDKNAKLMADLLQEEAFTLEPNPSKLLKILAPAGQCLYMVRLPQTGRVAFNVKTEKAVATKVIDNEKEIFDDEAVSEALANLTDRAMNSAEGDVADGKEMWSLLYGREFPEKGKKEEKTSKVNIAETRKSSTTGGNEGKKNSPQSVEKSDNLKMAKKETSDNCPVEDSYPQSKKSENPENTANIERVEGENVGNSSMETDVDNSENDENEDAEEAKTAAGAADQEGKAANQAADDLTEGSRLDPNTIRGYKAGITADIRTLGRLNEKHNYRAMRTKLEGMLNILKRIIEEGEE